MTMHQRTLEGTYLNVTSGFVYIFEELGWAYLPGVYSNTHHEANNGAAMMYWPHQDRPPAYPQGWKQVRETEEFVAKTAQITGDRVDERFITISRDDGTFIRAALTDQQLKSLRRGINDRLD